MSLDDSDGQIDQLVDATLETLEARRTAPTCTYRVQLRGDEFTFRDAAETVPYLRELGISHLYCSPYLKARPGSTHGYDIVDHSRLNPELGTDDDYREMIRALREEGMGHIVDIVPNHMGIADEGNAWWQDVLENGPGSPYASYFDINWRPAKQELRDKVLLPFLGDQYGLVLEEGHLQLEFAGGAFWLRCYDSRLPLDPKSYADILSGCVHALETELGAEADALRELMSIVWACENLPETKETDPERVQERQREKEVVKTRLDRLVTDEPIVGRILQEQLAALNGDPSDPNSFDALDALLDRQVYRLSHWKAASDEINYRRFFDINELAALCVEDIGVFDATHDLILQLLVQGDIDGLRIDHVDGLLDPAEYLRRLQRGYISRLGRYHFESGRQFEPLSNERTFRAAEWQGGRDGSAAVSHTTLAVDDRPVDVWKEIEPKFLRRFEERIAATQSFTVANMNRADADGHPQRATDSRAALPLYIVVEKILEGDEPIPANWPVAGTTGYGFLNRITALFVDPVGYRQLIQSYRRFTGIRARYEEIVSKSKQLILRVSMAAELQLLAIRLNRLSERHRRTRDFTLNNLRDVLQEILSCFPIYRTYLTREGVSDRDRRFLDIAVQRAQRANPALDEALFRFVRSMLLFEPLAMVDERSEPDRELFVGRFQQTSSPVMAKGTEDTAFYRYFPLCALNEVGGTPTLSDLNVSRFHHENRQRQLNRPASLTTSTTHDTKRTEDTRARITVLSQISVEWRKSISRWARMNRRHVRRLEAGLAPSRNDEYLFYQTLVGIWPTEPPDRQQRESLITRMQQYMAKATHEAKLYTSWVNPVEEYDEAVRDFVEAVLTPGPRNRFLADIQQFCDRILDAGLYTALGQLFLKMMSPGVPDIYQGQELWDFSLVDPDNRRPIDYRLRRRMLDEMKREYGTDAETRARFVSTLGRTPRDPRLKLFVTWRSLQYRTRSRALFERGEYVPLDVIGPQSEHVCAFAWRLRDEAPARTPALAIIITPRLLARLTPPDDEATTCPPCGPDVWSGTSVSLAGWGPTGLIDVFRGTTYSSARDRLDLAEVLAEFPLALLSNESDEQLI